MIIFHDANQFTVLPPTLTLAAFRLNICLILDLVLSTCNLRMGRDLGQAPPLLSVGGIPTLAKGPGRGLATDTSQG